MSNANIENIVTGIKLEKLSNDGPGAKLRKAREAKGLPIEEVARKLFLTVKMVRQIEEDNYHENKQAVIFIRGYFRSYARLVDMDANALIEEFNALGLTDAPPLMSTQRIYHRETSIINRAIPWVSTVVGICVVLLAVMWVHSEFSNNSVGNVASSLASTVVSAVTVNKAPPSTPATKQTISSITTSTTPVAAGTGAVNNNEATSQSPENLANSDSNDTSNSTSNSSEPINTTIMQNNQSNNSSNTVANDNTDLSTLPTDTATATVLPGNVKKKDNPNAAEEKIKQKKSNNSSITNNSPSGKNKPKIAEKQKGQKERIIFL